MPPRDTSIDADVDQHGFCHVREPVSRAEFDRICARLGVVMETTDVKLIPGDARWITKSIALPFHTDHVHANIIGWWCAQRSQGNEPIVLLDLRRVGVELPADTICELQRTYLPSADCRGITFPDAPILDCSTRLPRIHYQPWLIADRDDLRARPSVRRLAAYVRAKSLMEPQPVQLERGQMLFINGNAMLHGRRELAVASRRHLVRAWVRTDGIPGTRAADAHAMHGGSDGGSVGT